MPKLNFVFVLLMALFISCKKGKTDDESLLNIIPGSEASLVSLNESDYRPVYHFTPPLKWMNDPNGLVYYKGKYHLFYQYNPNSSVWGPMHWGHASSSDLFNWQDHPIALAPDNSGTIFSGSAVVDVNNTAGFKTGIEDPLIAIYTLAGAQQHQAIAYSNDGGFLWTKYPFNPVLPNPGVPDFRDPKVFWHTGSQKWVMALAAGNKISLYSSANLKSWAFESNFGETVGAHGGVWECPDLFELPVEGTNTSKWVLLVSINPGGPNGGSGTQYFVGSFDGTSFVSDTNQSSWLDYGTDNYAGVTYNNIPSADGRRVFIGWMSNWSYADKVPTASWRSTMTVPRGLSLAKNGEAYVLKSTPVLELESYKTDTPDTSILAPSKSIQLLNNAIVKSGTYEINFSADMGSTDNLLLSLGNSLEKISIRIDKVNGRIIIDRGMSGLIVNSHFGQQIMCSFIPKTDRKTKFQILVDKTSLELFIDDGEKVLTTLFFPLYQYNFLKLAGDGNSAVLSDFKMKKINKSLMR